MVRRTAVIALLTLFFTLISGCAGLSYYAQSVRGQLQIMAKSRDITDVLEDPGTGDRLRTRLSRMLVIRDFAVRELGLPDNDSYRRYADLGRQHVVWNVFAAPELSVEPINWCFPVVGCVVYRGYFSEQTARRFAQTLKNDGLDTHVGGISAYSTLGWFSDPVLNTFVERNEIELAGLVFHELTHPVVYIKNDSVFNESLATAIELEGMRRWLNNESDGDAIDEQKRRIQRSDEIIEMLLEYRDKLASAYAANETDGWKRTQKHMIIKEMRARYRTWAVEWDYTGFDDWFAQELNNAHFISATAYHGRVPAFTALLKRTPDIKTFWAEIRRVSKLSEDERNSVLDALTPAH